MSKEISIKNLSINVIENFSISFDNNNFYVISGPNRCGKTSLLKYLLNSFGQDSRYATASIGSIFPSISLAEIFWEGFTYT